MHKTRLSKRNAEYGCFSSTQITAKIKKTAGNHLLDFSPPFISLPVASTMDAWTAAELQQRTPFVPKILQSYSLKNIPHKMQTAAGDWMSGCQQYSVSRSRLKKNYCTKAQRPQASAV
jgi:hypothetical protein